MEFTRCYSSGEPAGGYFYELNARHHGIAKFLRLAPRAARQSEAEGRAESFPTLDANRPTVGLNESLNDRQPKA